QLPDHTKENLALLEKIFALLLWNDLPILHLIDELKESRVIASGGQKFRYQQGQAFSRRARHFKHTPQANGIGSDHLFDQGMNKSFLTGKVAVCKTMTDGSFSGNVIHGGSQTFTSKHL